METGIERTVARFLYCQLKSSCYFRDLNKKKKEKKRKKKEEDSWNILLNISSVNFIITPLFWLFMLEVNRGRKHNRNGFIYAKFEYTPSEILILGVKMSN